MKQTPTTYPVQWDKATNESQQSRGQGRDGRNKKSEKAHPGQPNRQDSSIKEGTA